MDKEYSAFGYIQFHPEKYAISIPVFKKNGSNHVFVPKTDGYFVIWDFYELANLNYPISYLSRDLPADIGDFAPVPICENGEVYVVYANWSDEEIRLHHPMLGNEALMSFASLKKRLAAASNAISEVEAEYSAENMLSEIVRSRYWVSRFQALTRVTFSKPNQEPDFVKKITDARDSWLNKFAHKSSISMVMRMCSIENISLERNEVVSVGLKRFEKKFLRQGIYISNAELDFCEEICPNGIVPAILADSADRPEYWDRTDKIGKILDTQLYDVFEKASSNGKLSYRHWSISQLERFLRVFEILDGDSYLFETAGRRFEPFRRDVLADLRIITANRYEWLAALDNRFSGSFSRAISEFITDEVSLSYDKIHQFEMSDLIRMVSMSYRKLIILTKIVQPPARRKSDAEIAYSMLDYALIDAILNAHENRNPNYIKSLINNESEDSYIQQEVPEGEKIKIIY